MSAGVPLKLPFYFEHYTLTTAHDEDDFAEVVIECDQHNLRSAEDWQRSRVEIDYPPTLQAAVDAVWAHQREHHQPKNET